MQEIFDYFGKNTEKGFEANTDCCSSLTYTGIQIGLDKGKLQQDESQRGRNQNLKDFKLVESRERRKL